MNIYRGNGYSTLKSCILCYPSNYRITNKSNKFYNNVDYTLALNQFNKYINYLIESNVKPMFLDITSSNHQVYSKDIAFVIENTLFISKMTTDQRSVETDPIKKLALDENLDHYIMNNNIEGGDVIIGDDFIFVGVSNRTNLQAIDELRKMLTLKGIKKEVIPINFDNNMLHLDCVFSLLGKDSALISPYVYDKEIIKKYIKNLIEVTKEDAESFGTNLVYLGNNKLITSNVNTHNKLKNLGYDSKFLDFSEIVKGGGSIDCCTLDLLRG